MDLHSDYPYWMIKTGLLASFPILSNDLSCDVLIVGAGITGALVATELARSGKSVVVIDKGHIGHGSTSASTAILQYEIDTPLFELIKRVGKRNAEMAYTDCCRSIDELAKISAMTPHNSEFEDHPSLYFSNSQSAFKQIILPEYKARKACGLEVDLLGDTAIHQRFKFNSSGGILSRKAAHLNPYKLCQHLFSQLVKAGHQVFSHTGMLDWKATTSGVTVAMIGGWSVKCKFLVIAAGYESQSYLDKKVTDFDSTYAIAGLPMHEKHPWESNAILWNTKDPYLYLRTTHDGRIIAGGRDEEFSNPAKRDKALKKKQLQLVADIQKLFPELNFQLDFAWAGTFAKTLDGLPYIGSFDQKRVLYAMGYGGNGITFSQIAAEILSDQISGIKNERSSLYSFERLNR